MRTHRWRIAAPLAALALIVGACSSDDDAQADDGIQPIESDDSDETDDPEPEPEPEPEPDPEPDPEPEPEPEEIDVTVIPDEITDEYVDAVLAELERIYAEAYAIVRDEQELTIEITDRVSSIFAESQVDFRYQEFIQLAEQPDLLRASQDIEPRTRDVVNLLDVSSECLWVETLTDPSGIAPEEQEPNTTFVHLRLKDVERPVDANPTPWVYGRLRTPAVDSDGEEIREDSPCAGD